MKIFIFSYGTTLESIEIAVNEFFISCLVTEL